MLWYETMFVSVCSLYGSVLGDFVKKWVGGCSESMDEFAGAKWPYCRLSVICQYLSQKLKN